MIQNLVILLSLNDLISSNSTTQNDILASSEPKTFTKLQEEITGAGDTLKLDSNYKRVEGDNEITISKDITIDGNGFTIDANKQGIIFKINNGCTVNLNNLTLANGKSYGGGAINVGFSVFLV